jgi:hypothetical protein
MVYTEAGLPIYSKCFGSFCQASFKNPELLSGFLSALETVPLTISEGLSLDSIRMGGTEMRFSKTFPTGHSVVVGMDADSQDLAESVFGAVDKVLKMDRFLEVDWTRITGDLMHDFESILVGIALPDALHDYDGFSDECPLGTQCLLHTNATMTTREKIWTSIRGRINSFRERMKRKSE